MQRVRGRRVRDAVARGVEVRSNAERRTWVVFDLPASGVVRRSTAYVPADDVEQARALLRRDSYDGAPVEEWPVLGFVFVSRDVLSAALVSG